MVRDTLDASLGEGWVVGEISNARLAPSNHFYFTLKDSRSAINVVMFKSAFQRMRFKVVDGMEVIVRGRVQVFEQRGALQLYAEEMEPRGVGALQVAFEQLKRRLEAEGLFDRARKRAMPFLPRRIGIVTARGGAGLRDMLRILFDRFPSVQVIFRPARVQGDGSAQEIADAIADLNRDGRAEVLIVGRGGGSLEDLWAFNEESRRARDFPIADSGNFRRRPRSRLHHRRFRRRPARAHSHRGRADGRAQPRRVEGTRRIARRVARERDGARTVGPSRIGGRPGGAHPPSRQHCRRGARARCRPRRRTRRRGVVANRGRSAQCPRIAPASSQSRRDRARPAPSHRPGSATILFMASRPLWKPNAANSAREAGRLDALSPLKVLDRGYAVVINKTNSRAVLDAATVKFDDELDIRLAKGRLSARATGRSL